MSGLLTTIICQGNDVVMSREKELLASFIANFKKGKKIADPVEYARTCKALVDLYGSPEDVAEKLGIGKETVRILTKVVDLPSEVQDLVSKRKIPLTVAFDIVPVDRAIQIEVARAVSGLRSRDAREVIRRVSKNPRKSAESIRSEVLSELEKREVNIVMIAFSKDIYTLLEEQSKDVRAFITRVVEEWLEKNGGLDYSYKIQRHDLVSLAVRLSRATFAALTKKTRNPANLVERIVVTWLKQREKIK